MIPLTEIPIPVIMSVVISMVKRDDFVVIKFNEEELKELNSNAGEATLGGNSQVRSSADRSKTCSSDQLVGQMGELALHKFAFGDRGFEFYKKSRAKRNATPHRGDDGQDFFDGEKHIDIDVKCTRLKEDAKAIRYNMVVPSKEFYHDWIYVQAFCGMANGKEKNDAIVLVGWCISEDIAEMRDFKGYGNRHFCGVHELRPMSELTPEIIAVQGGE